MVKNPPANARNAETQVQSLGWEDPLEEEMAAHSRILAWRIPWTEPRGLQCMGSQTVTTDTAERVSTRALIVVPAAAQSFKLILFHSSPSLALSGDSLLSILPGSGRFLHLEFEIATVEKSDKISPMYLKAYESVSCSAVSDFVQPHGL